MNATTNRASALKLLITLTLAVTSTTGCTTHRSAYERGLEAELSRNYDLALEHYEEALADPRGLVARQSKL